VVEDNCRQSEKQETEPFRTTRKLTFATELFNFSVTLRRMVFMGKPPYCFFHFSVTAAPRLEETIAANVAGILDA